MSQCPLLPPGKLMQSSLQLHSDTERSLCPQVTPGPSPEPNLPVHPCLPTLRTVSVYPIQQIPSIFSVSSGCEGSLSSTFTSNKYSYQQFCLEGPRSQWKEHTVYTNEQKLLLQEHFDQCVYPRLKERVELALEIGVTKYEIKVCLLSCLCLLTQNSHGISTLTRIPHSPQLLNDWGSLEELCKVDLCAFMPEPVYSASIRVTTMEPYYLSP